MYIRTKDGRIIAFGKEYAYPTRIVKGNQRYIFTELTEATFEKMKEFNHWEILKQSDTIEELCDCIIETKGHTGDYFHYTYTAFDEPSKKRLLDDMINQDFEVYYAIWTDKGLIYVAKMDSDGKLVLI